MVVHIGSKGCGSQTHCYLFLFGNFCQIAIHPNTESPWMSINRGKSMTLKDIPHQPLLFLNSSNIPTNIISSPNKFHRPYSQTWHFLNFSISFLFNLSTRSRIFLKTFFDQAICTQIREPRRDSSNLRLYDHGISNSNSQPVPSKVRADSTRPHLTECLFFSFDFQLKKKFFVFLTQFLCQAICTQRTPKGPK